MNLEPNTKKTVLLLHSACLSWRMFRPAVERLQTQYHLIIPALPAHDPDEKRRHTRAWRPSRPSWAAG